MDISKYFGHIQDDEMTDIVLSRLEFPIAKPVCSAIFGSSKRKERVILTDFLVQLLGKWPHFVQATSDCTAFGACNVVHILKAIQCLQGKQEWVNSLAQSITYAGSRVEIGKNRWYNTGGATGSATAECVQKLGTLHRGKYLNKYDFSEYSGDVSDRLGKSGIPDDLEPIMRDFTVKSVSLVTDVETALDCLANGYPLTIASQVGLAGRKDSNGRLLRDSDGCLKVGDSWPHQLALIAYDLNPKRPKVGIANSWPLGSMTGPLDGLSEGCFWADLDVLRIILQSNDSFVYSDYSGYPVKELNLRLL